MTNEGVQKILGAELPIPSEWRAPLKRIADQLVLGTVPMGQGIRPIDADMLALSLDTITAYPDKIGLLERKTWTSSIYAWMGDHWHVLIDLSREDGEMSDLVMPVRVYELAVHYEFEVDLIHIP